jgi:hypothetical protein
MLFCNHTLLLMYARKAFGLTIKVCYRATQRPPLHQLSFPRRLSDFPTLYHVVFIELPGVIISVFIGCC